MSEYQQSANYGQQLIFKFLKERMKENKITQTKLADQLNISVTTLIRYFKQETPMPLDVFLKICGVLQLRPYLVPSESDTNEMHRISFN